MKEKSPAFLFYPADFLNDPNVKFMSLDAKGAYVMLLCHAWREQYIPNDIPKLAKLAECSEETMSAIWPTLKGCFSASKKENLLMHPRLEKERKKLKKSSETRTEKAKKAAKARWEAPRKGYAPSNAQAMLGDAISISRSITSDPPLTPPGGQSAWESGCEPGSPSAASLISEFQGILRQQGKTVFGDRWFAQNVKCCEELLAQGQSSTDIRDCMHWLAKDSTMAPYVNHFKQIIRHWNTWVGHTSAKVEQAPKKEYWQRILAAETVAIEGPSGSFQVAGNQLEYDSKARQFIYQGQAFDVCYVSIAGRVA